MAPTELRRLVDAAKLGLKDAQWGTQLGLLVLSGKITATQYTAGKRWSELARDYGSAIGGPRQPRSAGMELGQGETVDPDSLRGRREALRHVKAAETYQAAAAALGLMGKPARVAVVDVCEQGLAPLGVYDMAALQTGLTALVKHWERK
jgi:hypothetical protein